MNLSWWRHQMEIFSAQLAFCAGNSAATGEFPWQKLATRSFDAFFDLHLNQTLSKQWNHRWFETPSRSLWRHCNVAWSVFFSHMSLSWFMRYQVITGLDCSDHFVHGFSQWELTLQSNVVSLAERIPRMIPGPHLWFRRATPTHTINQIP